MSPERSVSPLLSLLLILSVLLSQVLIGGAVCAQIGLGQVGSLKRSPADLVKRYVRLDQKGARLDVMGFDVMAPYVNWKEEEAWSLVVVIDSADVPEDYRKWDIRDNLDVIIPVTFHVRGEVDLKTATFTPDDRMEEVRFHVKAVGNSWRIVEPKIPPHVGLTRMLNFVRQAGLETTDDAQRRLLASLESSLREGR
ncbi:MAG: hypothetical protein ACK4VP_03750 [Nitrospira sp.]